MVAPVVTRAVHLEAFQTRRFLPEINSLHEGLRKSPMQDPLTNSARELCVRFHCEVHRDSQDLESKRKTFIRQLQELLVDPLTRTALDKEALLGSDQRTYGYKALTLHLHALKGELSPGFVTTPHFVARRLIAWLIQIDAHAPAAWVQAR